MTVISVEIGRTIIQWQPRRKLARTPPQQKTEHGGMHLIIPAMWEALLRGSQSRPIWGKRRPYYKNN
jgi:hypothetical protein